MNIASMYKVKPSASIPKLSPGDTVKVVFKVKEASRERLQTFNGLVIKLRRGIGGGSFTIRRVVSGIGVEHTFPFASPLLDKVEVVRHGKVRRAKLYYMRRLSAKEARLKERREILEEQSIAPEISKAELAENPIIEETKVVEEAKVAEESKVTEGA